MDVTMDVWMSLWMSPYVTALKFPAGVLQESIVEAGAQTLMQTLPRRLQVFGTVDWGPLPSGND